MTPHSLGQCPRSLQFAQAVSYSAASSSRPTAVDGQSQSIGGGLFSRNSRRTGSIRFVQHDQHPSGSFFDACPALNRAKPIEITCAANRAPGSACTDMVSPMFGGVPLRQHPTRLSPISYQHLMVNPALSNSSAEPTHVARRAHSQKIMNVRTLIKVIF